jgi:hypothetical protein
MKNQHISNQNFDDVSKTNRRKEPWGPLVVISWLGGSLSSRTSGDFTVCSRPCDHLEDVFPKTGVCVFCGGDALLDCAGMERADRLCAYCDGNSNPGALAAACSALPPEFQ